MVELCHFCEFVILNNEKVRGRIGEIGDGKMIFSLNNKIIIIQWNLIENILTFLNLYGN